MKNIQKVGEEIGYFNLARGVGMLLIILGHSVNLYSPLHISENGRLFAGAGTIMGGGLMAAFFMISGFNFFRRSFLKCFSIQKKILLWPYCVTAAAILATKFLLAIVKRRSFLKHGGELIPTYILGLNAEGGGEILGIPVESVSIFWFVLALFGGWMIYNSVKHVSSKRLRFWCVIGCVLLGYGMTLLSSIWPFCLPIALLAVGYLAAGSLIKEKELLSRKIPWKWRCGGIAVTLISAAFGGVNIVTCTWKLGLIDVAGSFCAGFLILKGYALLMRRGCNNRVTGALEEIGLHSIWIVCLHAYEKVIFPWYRIAEIFPNNPVIGISVCFIGRCAVMYVLYRCIRAAAKRRKLRRLKALC